MEEAVTESEISRYMKLKWNLRAEKNPFYYIETEYWDGNLEKFFDAGEERARILVDPALTEIGLSPAGKMAIDIGCGVGRFGRALSSRFARVIGLDVSENMIKTALSINPPHLFPNLCFSIGDGCTLPLGSRSVDFAYSYEVFQHMPSHEVIASNLKEIERVLVSGGYALLHFKTTPDGIGPMIRQFYLDHVGDYFEQSLKQLLGKDTLKADAAFRGAPPLDQERIGKMCASAGLEVVRFRDDPTHALGTRIFAIVRQGVVDRRWVDRGLDAKSRFPQPP